MPSAESSIDDSAPDPDQGPGCAARSSFFALSGPAPSRDPVHRRSEDDDGLAIVNDRFGLTLSFEFDFPEGVRRPAHAAWGW